MFSTDGEDYFDIIGLRQLGRARGLRCALRIVWWLVIACLGFRKAHAQCPAIVNLLLPQFIAHDFAVKSFGPIRWLNRSQSHTILVNTNMLYSKWSHLSVPIERAEPNSYGPGNRIRLSHSAPIAHFGSGRQVARPNYPG